MTMPRSARWPSATRLLCLVAALGALLPMSVLADQRAKIEAVHGTVISSELAGRIDDLPYREGDSFGKGVTLARIDCKLYSAERNRVSAKLSSAQRKMENNQRLAELNSVGKLDVDLSALDVKQTRAELSAAQINVNRCGVTAPYAGRVVRLFANEGQSVQAQEKLLEIVGRELEARIIVPARWLSWLDKGTKVDLAVEETGEHVDAAVTRIGASVDAVSHTIPVWASIKESSALRPGMTASAIFPGHAQSGQAQPSESTDR